MLPLGPDASMLAGRSGEFVTQPRVIPAAWAAPPARHSLAA